MQFTKFLTPFLAAAMLCTAASSLTAADSFYLKDGDRVVFYGDSITDQRLYTTFAETFVVTRFPDRNITFVHSGWGGDRVTGGGGGPIDLRLKRDVLAYKPTVMTIMLGMNDASYRAVDEGIFNTYKKGYANIIQTMKGEIPNLRITVIQPSPFDDVTRPPNFPGGYNNVLLHYGAWVKELAEREKLHFADLNTYVVEATKKAFETDGKQAEELNKDRVHPGLGGQLLMAAALLKSWNAPAMVSSVEINGTTGKAVKAEKTSVTDLKASDTGITWTQIDTALPFPLNTGDATIALALKSSDIVSSLNQQLLKVSDLKDGRYQLKIDGQDVKAFSSQELSAGINLAMIKTPMAKQADEVHKLTLRHNDVHFFRWRQIQVPLAQYNNEEIKRGTKDILAGLDAEELVLVKQQREKAKPVAHSMALVRLP